MVCHIHKRTQAEGVRVLHNRIMKELFRPKREKVTRDWRKMHNGELCDLYSSLNTTRRRWDLQGMQHKCRRREMHTEYWLWNAKQRDYWENVGTDMSVILKRILKKLDRLDSSGSGWYKWQTPVNIVNETLASTKCTNLSIVWAPTSFTMNEGLFL